MKTTRVVPLLLLFAALALPAHAAGKAAAGWEKMLSLVGEWAWTAEGKTTTVTYKLVSSGTALMETIDGADHEQMITMYHPDGDSLLLTHYCSMGNQPRMRAKGLEDGKITFVYVDAANLKAPDDPRMSGLVIHFQDADHVVAEWTFKAPSKDQVEKFALTRKK
jgi:hypothetical protein